MPVALDWTGKDAVLRHLGRLPAHGLRPIPELSAGEPGTGNMIIQGDSLHALGALLPHWAGQVKCACIDPPYNTGNEGWLYSDGVSSPKCVAGSRRSRDRTPRPWTATTAGCA